MDNHEEVNTLIEEEGFKCNIQLYINQKLNITLTVYIGIFTRIYNQVYKNNQIPSEIGSIFEDIDSLYQFIQQEKDDKSKIIMHLDSGQIQIRVNISINNKKHLIRSVFLKLQRKLDEQMNEIRLQIKDDEDLRRSVEHLWRRQEENEKIFFKFKEETEYKLQQVNERMSIQNTKIAIMREDVNRISLHLENLTRILCPLLSNVNINSQYLSNFLLQDQKINYAGSNDQWTQIFLNNRLNYGERFQISFRILNCKKNNIVVGLTKSSFINMRTSLKKDSMLIGYSASGILHRKSDQQKIGVGLKPMQKITMIIDFQKQKILWKNESAKIVQVQLGTLKSYQVSPCIQFCNSGDCIQFL